jgi:hypothetical protein
MLNSYLSLEKDPSTNSMHPLLRGFEDAGRIINAVNQVDVTPADANQFAPLRIVPSYPDLPMESVFTRPGGAHCPGVYVQRVGATAAWSIFPVTSIAPSGRCSAPITEAAAKRGRVGHKRSSASYGGRQGHSGCGCVGAKNFDDSAPRQSHQSHDDERPGDGRSFLSRAKISLRIPAGIARQPRSSARRRQRRSVPHGARYDSSLKRRRSAFMKWSPWISQPSR